MTLRDGLNLSTWEGGYFDRDNENSVSLLYRLLWVFTEWRATTPLGLGLNEAGRPLGVPGDTDVGRRGGSASETASGTSTVFYQFGRYLLWRDTGGKRGTPSAADPNGTPSRHMIGTASDLDANDYARLDRLMERVGMKRTISSEIWHYEIYRNPDPDIDFSRFDAVVDAILGRSGPSNGDPDERDIEMGTKEILADNERVRTEIVIRQDRTIIPLLQAIAAAVSNDDAQVERIINAVQREGGRPRLYRLNDPANKRHGLIAAIDIDEGYYRGFTSMAEYQNAKRLQEVAPEEPLNISAEEFENKERLAADRLAQLVADPEVPEVTDKDEPKHAA